MEGVASQTRTAPDVPFGVDLNLVPATNQRVRLAALALRGGG